MLLGALFICAAVPARAQLLKKLKEKVNKAVGNDDGNKSSQESGSPGSSERWCDTITVDAVNGDGVSYSKAYSGSGNVNILYDESTLGLVNNPSGYRLILSEYAGGKTQYTVVENGKVIATDTKVKPEYLARGTRSESSDNPDSEDPMKKYIIADSSKMIIPKTEAKSATIKKIDNNQMDMALNVLRQTDEYKSKTPEEQKELEETIKKGMAMNNSMAGQTFGVPASQGGSFTRITGYKVIVKGKNYGKFMMRPALAVSHDETSVFAVGMDDKGAPVMVTQAKKTPLDKTKFTGSGKMLISHDGKKAVYYEMKQLTDAETNMLSSGNYAAKYNVLRPDGSSLQITDYSGMSDFRLTDAGAVINVNENTGEVYADGKKLGQFKLSSGDRLESRSVLIGSTPSSIAYYEGSKGSLHYLDGSTRALGIMFPHVVTQNGKTYMTWFRKCRNDIYIGRFSY